MHNAYLYIDEFKFPIKYLEYNFRQFTGTNNKPNTRVFGGQFSFTFDIDDKKAIHLIEWMFSSTMQKNGYIEIMDFNQTSIDFKLEFANAYATSQLFHYDATSNLPLQSNVTVTAGAIRFNKDVTFLQTWNPKDPFAKQASPITKDESEDRVLVTAVTGPKELTLNQKGIYEVTSFNKIISKQEEQKIKWAIKLDEKTTLLEFRGKKIEYIPKKEDLKNKQIIIMPYLVKSIEKVSVKTKIVDFKKEILLIIGTEQHSTNAANKLMFPAQAVREVRENFHDTPNLEVLIFKDGYTEKQLNAFSNSILSYNKESRVILINSVEELINFINVGSRKTNKESKYRESQKISKIKIFAHGYVRNTTNEGVIAFGLDGINASKQELDNENFKKINKNAFLTNSQSHLYSYACRTGIGISGEIVKKPLKSNSLAQKMSNHSQIVVHAYMKRSLYEDTWGTQNHRDTYISDNDKGESFMENLKTDIKDAFSDDPNDMDSFAMYISTEKKIDGAIWNTKGAYLPVKAGDFPKGISSNYEIFKPE